MDRIATITVSDTRNQATDEGGPRLRALFTAAGFCCTFHAIVADEPTQLVDVITRVCDEDLADVVVTTGGTGIAPRDRSYEAIDGLLEKRLDGFGEAFRRLSWDSIGPRAILSRAVAGTYRGKIVVALPGSPKALDLAVSAILVPVLPHALAMARGESHAPSWPLSPV